MVSVMVMTMVTRLAALIVAVMSVVVMVSV